MEEIGDKPDGARRTYSKLAGEALLALSFLTRLPIRSPGQPESSAGDLARAAWAFPLVGLFVGAMAAAVYIIASALGLAPLPSAVLAVCAQLLTIGALHEDGLADVADGFGGGESRDRKLEIMRDSRIGTYGVAALVLALTARIGAVGSLIDPLPAAAALIAAGAVSRGAIVGLMRWLAPARREGLGAGAGRPNGRVTAVAFGLSAASALALGGFWPMVFALAFSVLVVAALGVIAQRQIGGQTGDVLGAGQQLCEIAVLFTAVAGGW